MKKQLLTATIMLTGMFVLTPSIADAKSSMDSNLKLLWMNTDVAPLHTSARQGFGMNGKFYLQNKDTKQIEVWDETGKITDIPSGEGPILHLTMRETSLCVLELLTPIMSVPETN